MNPHHSKSSGSNTGCFAIAGIALFLILAAAGAVIFTRKASHDSHMVEAMDAAHGHSVTHAVEVTSATKPVTSPSAQEDRTVRIDRNELSKFSPTDFGETLTLEHFVAVALADDTTSLARNLFAKEIQGEQVEWFLQLVEIKEAETDEVVTASFMVPYRFFRASRNHSSSSGGTARITAKFPPEAVPELAKIRKGQWVKISGKLEHSTNGKTVLHASKIVSTEE